MRAIIVAAGASLFTLGSLVWPSTAVADYEVCNKTDTDVYVAYGFINPAGGGWATKGWRRVDANGECELLVKSGWTSDPHHYWAYAEEVGGGRVWSGESPFCTTNNSFGIVGPQNADNWCANRGYQTRYFFHVEAPDGNWRTNLTTSDGGQPIDDNP